MSTKPKSKKQYEKLQGEQWIEMEDLADPQNQSLSRKFAEQEGKKYESTVSYPSFKSNLNQKQQGATNRFAETSGSRQVSHNKENERKQPPRGDKKMKKTSIPMMLVMCQYCTVSQNVPGNTQLYTCGSCQNINECQPLYGVFNCGNCQSKVCYGFGISVMIKCPKCKSINKVPAEPIKKYESSQIPQIRREKKQKEGERQQPNLHNKNQAQQQIFVQNESLQNERVEPFKYPGVD